MSVTRQARSIQFTSTNSALDLAGWLITIIGITFQGTGLTFGQRLLMRDTATPGTGSVVVDYLTAPNSDGVDNGDLWMHREQLQVSGLAIDNATVGGTWTLTVFYR